MLDESNISFDNLEAAIYRLRDIKIVKLPIDPWDVIIENHWNLCSYDVFCYVMKMKSVEIKHISDTAFSTYSSRKGYIVVYNPELPVNRIRFNLAHEIGHIFLGHINPDFTFIEDLPQKEKALREHQADAFARYVLGMEF